MSSPPVRKKQKLMDNSSMSIKELSNQSNQSNNIAFIPKYKSMNDLNLSPNYKPIYCRNHLKKYLNNLNLIQIPLTNSELKTFSLFKLAISDTNIFPIKPIIRCAGGWVRDKLLNCNSDDIDLAINNMTGEQFGDKLSEYLKLKQNLDIKIGKIIQNPNKSKQLASITFKLNDIEFDVVNLRNEVYSNNSRIPLMTFGTPKQDAFRRDLTINSLFYNINDNKIEDFTQNGINHLISGLAQTPLNAMITFQDDPLRILRNIRHGITKLGFELHSDIIQAAQNPEIHKLLKYKVSRERFAIEFDKILKGYNCNCALNCLFKFGIIDILFKLPNQNQIKFVPKSFNKDNVWQNCIKLTENVTNIVLTSTPDDNKDNNDIIDVKTVIGADKQRELMFATFTYPFHGITYSLSKKRVNPLIMYFVLNSIPGMPNATKLGEICNNYHIATDMFIEILLLLQSGSLPNDELSLKIGKFLMVCKENWIYVIYLIKSVCILYNKQIDIKTIDELKSWIQTKSNLINCWKWKPLINGNDLLVKYAEYGLGRDARITKLYKYILSLRLSKPSIVIDDINDLLIEWIKQNPAPQHHSKSKKKKKIKKSNNKNK